MTFQLAGALGGFAGCGKAVHGFGVGMGVRGPQLGIGASRDPAVALRSGCWRACPLRGRCVQFTCAAALAAARRGVLAEQPGPLATLRSSSPPLLPLLPFFSSPPQRLVAPAEASHAVPICLTTPACLAAPTRRRGASRRSSGAAASTSPATAQHLSLWAPRSSRWRRPRPRRLAAQHRLPSRPEVGPLGALVCTGVGSGCGCVWRVGVV